MSTEAFVDALPGNVLVTGTVSSESALALILSLAKRWFGSWRKIATFAVWQCLATTRLRNSTLSRVSLPIDRSVMGRHRPADARPPARIPVLAASGTGATVSAETVGPGDGSGCGGRIERQLTAARDARRCGDSPWATPRSMLEASVARWRQWQHRRRCTVLQSAPLAVRDAFVGYRLHSGGRVRPPSGVRRTKTSAGLQMTSLWQRSCPWVSKRRRRSRPAA